MLLDRFRQVLLGYLQAHHEFHLTESPITRSTCTLHQTTRAPLRYVNVNSIGSQREKLDKLSEDLRAYLVNVLALSNLDLHR